jgi:hypothetical protein
MKLGEFLGQNRHAQIAGLDTLDGTELQHLHDLLRRGAEREGGLDVTPRPRRVHMRVRGGEGDVLISPARRNVDANPQGIVTFAEWQRSRGSLLASCI